MATNLSRGKDQPHSQLSSQDYNGLENYNRLELDFCKEDAAVESEPASGGEAIKELNYNTGPPYGFLDLVWMGFLVDE
ncbi:unnamed protein product [Rhizophagus irregularis]|nr:unnamed protein product [Rhizophagus irregularis]